MSAIEQPVLRRKLPVWATVRRSYTFLWDYRGIVLLPVLLLILATLILRGASIFLAFGELSPAAAVTFTDSASYYGRLGLGMLPNLLATALTITLMIGIHRLVLLGELRRNLGFFRFDRRFGRYLLTIVLMFVIVILSCIAAGLLIAVIGVAAGLAGAAGEAASRSTMTGLVGLVMALFLLFVTVRLQLALPAAALDREDTIGAAWRATRGNVLRMAAILVLTMIPLVVVVALVAPLLGMQMEEARQAAERGTYMILPPQWSAMVAGAVIGTVQMAIFATMLSLCYDVLARGGGPATEPEFEPSVIP